MGKNKLTIPRTSHMHGSNKLTIPRTSHMHGRVAMPRAQAIWIAESLCLASSHWDCRVTMPRLTPLGLQSHYASHTSHWACYLAMPRTQAIGLRRERLVIGASQKASPACNATHQMHKNYRPKCLESCIKHTGGLYEFLGYSHHTDNNFPGN